MPQPYRPVRKRSTFIMSPFPLAERPTVLARRFRSASSAQRQLPAAHATGGRCWGAGPADTNTHCSTAHVEHGQSWLQGSPGRRATPARKARHRRVLSLSFAFVTVQKPTTGRKHVSSQKTPAHSKAAVRCRALPWLTGLGPHGPPPSFGPVAVRVVGFRLMGALPSVVDGCEVAER